MASKYFILYGVELKRKIGEKFIRKNEERSSGDLISDIVFWLKK
jgi:hypothetical protein